MRVRPNLSLAAMLSASALLICTQAFAADERFPQTLPKTKPLTETKPLDEVMISGINKFAERELTLSVIRREKRWNRDYRSHKAYARSVSANRKRLAKILGVVDARVKNPRFEIVRTLTGSATAGVNKTDGSHVGTKTSLGQRVCPLDSKNSRYFSRSSSVFMVVVCLVTLATVC